MKHLIKRIGFLTVALALLLVCVAIPEAGAATCIDSGKMPGTNLFWELTKDGTLTLYGGDVPDHYVTNSVYPWTGYKDMIKTIVLGDGVTRVGTYAFYEYGELKTLIMSDSVRYIDMSAFWCCWTLENITFSQNLEVIGDTSFCNCAMTDVVVPDSVREIGPYAFANNGNLKTFKFPKNLTKISYYMFWGGSGLHTVTMGDKVEIIEENAFYCPNLTNMNLSTSLSLVENGGLSSSRLESILVPGSLTSVAGDSFGSGWNAGEITISEGVKVLKGFPSDNKKITEYVIPSTVVNIGKGTFNNCTTAERIIFRGDAPLFHSDIFHNVTADIAYPKNRADWTADVMVDYQGDLTWRPYGTPVFTSQPQNDFGKVGTEVTFSVRTDIDTGWPSYQWQVSTDEGETWTNYTGAGADTATICLTVTEDIIGNLYRCEVTDGICFENSTSEAGQIRTPVEIIRQPGHASAKLNETASTAVTAVGKGLKYQWFEKEEGSAAFSESSVTQASYSSDMTMEKDGRELYCVITDCFGNTVTTDTVRMQLTVTVTAQPESQMAVEGAEVNTTVAAVGSDLQYQWYVKDRDAQSFSESSIKTASYSVTMSYAIHGRQIYCIITDRYGNQVTTDTVTLSVDHTHNYSAAVTAPTCTEDGYTTYTCKCGDSYVADETDALGHDFGAWVESKKPGCTTEGEEVRDCNRCDHYETRAIASTGHSYTPVVTDATCTADGYTTYYCACGDRYVADETDALGHDMEEWMESKAPGCTEPGEEIRGCSRCDHTEKREIEATGHDWCDWQVIREATEETEGEEQHNCRNCGKYETRPIPKLDHVHKYESAVTDPTCTEGGYTTYTCRCGDSYVEDETEALGHEFTHGECIRCGTEDPDYVPENPFADVKETDYYLDPVLWAVKMGITAGTGEGQFSPNQTCTRAQVVTFLWRSMGKPEPKLSVNPFDDVTSNDYYYNAVLWAVENGITSGTSARTFSPNNPCTRDQVVTFLWRAMGKPAPEKTDNPFADVTEGVYYYEPVLWAVEKGITSGTSATTFAPGTHCTRGQVVTFLYRAMKDK